MVLLSVVTYAIYVPYWFVSRRQSVNALLSEKKLWRNPLVVLLVWAIVDTDYLWLLLSSPIWPFGRRLIHWPTNSILGPLAS